MAVHHPPLKLFMRAVLMLVLVGGGVFAGASRAWTDTGETWQRYQSDGVAALRRGAPAEAERAFRTALALIPPDDWRRVKGLQLVGQALHARGAAVDAESFYRQAVALAGRLAAGDDRRLLVPLTTLASFLLAERRYDEATSTYDRTFEITQRGFGESNPRTTMVATVLAEIELMRDNMDAAEAWYRRALSPRIAPPPVPDDIVRALDLAWVQRARGRLDAARALEASVRRDFSAPGRNWEGALRGSVTVSAGMLGPGHPMVAVPVRHLAMFLEAQSRFSEARATFEKALKLLDIERLGDSVLMAAALEIYAELVRRMGDDTTAHLSLGRAAAIRDKHPR